MRGPSAPSFLSYAPEASAEKDMTRALALLIGPMLLFVLGAVARATPDVDRATVQGRRRKGGVCRRKSQCGAGTGPHRRHRLAVCIGIVPGHYDSCWMRHSPPPDDRLHRARRLHRAQFHPAGWLPGAIRFKPILLTACGNDSQRSDLPGPRDFVAVRPRFLDTTYGAGDPGDLRGVATR
jgi:hypothetical protein